MFIFSFPNITAVHISRSIKFMHQIVFCLSLQQSFNVENRLLSETQIIQMLSYLPKMYISEICFSIITLKPPPFAFWSRQILRMMSISEWIKQYSHSKCHIVLIKQHLSDMNHLTELKELHAFSETRSHWLSVLVMSI